MSCEPLAVHDPSEPRYRSCDTQNSELLRIYSRCYVGEEAYPNYGLARHVFKDLCHREHELFCEFRNGWATSNSRGLETIKASMKVCFSARQAAEHFALNQVSGLSFRADR
eukprot:12911020-Prorocentrum_lima.AAC.1